MTMVDPENLSLERRGYRRRRLRDAVRLLPVLGVFLWMFPLFWPVGDRAAPAVVPMSSAMIYLFTVWLIMIVVGGAFWLALRHFGSSELAETPLPPDP